MKPDLPEPIATASIERGATTNRVALRKARARRRVDERRYRADLSLAGTGTTHVCVSLPPELLVELDRALARVQMSRSQLFREAAKRLIASLKEPTP